MGNQNQKVSIIIPTYNRPTRLKRALRSIASQQYPNIEIVVVDDASEDPVLPIVNEVRDEKEMDIQVLRHSENKGASAARNTGIRNSKGDFLAFIDDDDIWYPDKITKQVESLTAASDDTGLVYCEMDIINEDGEFIRRTRAKHSGNITKLLLRRNVIGSFSCVMVKRDIVNQTGLLDDRFPSWQDLEWYIRLSRYCAVDPIAEPLAARYVGDYRQISDNINDILEITHPMFIEKYRPLAASFGSKFEREFEAWSAFRVGAWYALPNNHQRTARKYIGQAIQLNPMCLIYYPYFILSLLNPGAHEFVMTIKNRLRRIGPAER